MTKKKQRCESGKVPFRDRIAAELFIAKLQNRGQEREHMPSRAYRCPHCKKWHLTHQEKRG